ncbi:hypothetical protein C4D60_Mb04t33840 [Musa balbisiana]|uniref:Uncharacterized protein n=1 Tax=Musa balbisiana TaxID=52838 RepID=A0A4S8KGS5_MUSBA|nr:hypothetical protein C4D60_Mb04t33840 [Musa balbisiana]
MESSMASLAIVLHVCAGNYCSRYPLTEPPCTPSGYVRGNSRNCTSQDSSDCCKEGELYPQYQCSPPVTGDTPAHMTIASFAKGGDGGGPAECDGRYHSDDQMLASLSTGWYDDGSRCNRSIRISGNGRSVLAKVVDECDSVYGCEADQSYPPCPNNVIVASPAVWTALAIPEAQVGDYDVTWSDA